MNRNLSRFCAIAIMTAGVISGLRSVAAASDNEPINISFGDFKQPVSDIMESVDRVEAIGQLSSSTADYARAYSRLQDDLKKAKPPVSQWNEGQKDRLRNLPEPTEEAWQALDDEKAATERRIQQRNAESKQAYDENLKRQEEVDRQQAREDREQREADLQQARIDEIEARTNYYDNNSYGYYGGSWWSGRRPWYGHRPIRPEIGRPNYPKDDNYNPRQPSIKPSPNIKGRPGIPR